MKQIEHIFHVNDYLNVALRENEIVVATIFLTTL